MRHDNPNNENEIIYIEVTTGTWGYVDDLFALECTPEQIKRLEGGDTPDSHLVSVAQESGIPLWEDPSTEGKLGKKIPVIRALREATWCSLLHAKRTIDSIFDDAMGNGAGYRLAEELDKALAVEGADLTTKIEILQAKLVVLRDEQSAQRSLESAQDRYNSHTGNEGM